MADKISVLMPTYNRAHLIGVSIKSILSQTHKNVVLCIYDDGSTDNTEDVVKSFGDNRIIYHKSGKNSGCPVARNKLLEMANTRYACWQDSDDISNKHRIREQLKAIKKSKAAMVWSTFRWFDKDIGDSWMEEPKSHSGTAAHASIMFEVSKAVPFRLVKTLGGEDAKWRREIESVYGRTLKIPKILYYVRKHNDRIGVWKKNPKANKDWYNRMVKR